MEIEVFGGPHHGTLLEVEDIHNHVTLVGRNHNYVDYTVVRLANGVGRAYYQVSDKPLTQVSSNQIISELEMTSAGGIGTVIELINRMQSELFNETKKNDYQVDIASLETRWSESNDGATFVKMTALAVPSYREEDTFGKFIG